MKSSDVAAVKAADPYGEVVRLSDGRVAILGPPGEGAAERILRLINTANAVASVLAAEFAACHPVTACEFRKIGDAAAGLVQAVESFRGAAVARLGSPGVVS